MSAFNTITNLVRTNVLEFVPQNDGFVLRIWGVFPILHVWTQILNSVYLSGGRRHFGEMIYTKNLVRKGES